MAEFSVIMSDLKTKADELTELNQQFFTQVGNLEETEGALNGMWEGEAKNQFHIAFTSDVGQMHKFYNAIGQYVEALNAILSLYSKAEGQNVEIAKTRTAR